MAFNGIADAIGKWIIIRFASWPDDLKSSATGLFDVENRWLQFKLQGVDNFGVWLENPYFQFDTSESNEDDAFSEQKEALRGGALVLVKWHHIATILYLKGEEVDQSQVPLGFKPTK
jgi:hypothetical protein